MSKLPSRLPKKVVSSFLISQARNIQDRIYFKFCGVRVEFDSKSCFLSIRKQAEIEASDKCGG